MKKKIAFFTLSMKRGGAERVIANLCNELVNYYEVHLLLFDREIDYELDKDIRVSFLTKSGDTRNGFAKLLTMPYFAVRLRTWTLANKIDILFSFLFRPNIISVIMKFWYRDLKIVISERSNPWLQYKKNNTGNIINRKLLKYLYPKANLITVNSYGSKYAMLHYYSIKEKTPIKIIRNPINHKFIQKNNSENSKKKFIYLTVGRLDEGKNHSLLLDSAARLIKESIIEFELWIIGKGPLEGELKKKAVNLKIESFVKFLGYIPDVHNYMSKSDVFVFASKREGFPNVILEAMATGLPIISTDCAYGPREIIQGQDVLPNSKMSTIDVSKNGILVPINNLKAMTDALKLIYRNESLVKSLTGNYKEALDKYRSNVIVKEYLQIIENKN